MGGTSPADFSIAGDASPIPPLSMPMLILKVPRPWLCVGRINPRTAGGGGYPPSGFSQIAKKMSARSAAKFA